MNKKQKKELYDSQVVRAHDLALAYFSTEEDGEEMAQEVAFQLYEDRLQIMANEDWLLSFDEEIYAAVMVVQESRRLDGFASHVNVGHARNETDGANPYHYVIAKEMLWRTYKEGITDLMLGYSLSEIAARHGVSKQRVHQMLNIARENMSEYLEA